MKIGDYVKTYNLCDGKIKIGKIEHIFNSKDKIIILGSANYFKYNNSENYIQIPFNTLIWDENNKRYVFKYSEKYEPCFSTIVINSSDNIEHLIIEDENIEIEVNECCQCGSIENLIPLQCGKFGCMDCLNKLEKEQEELSNTFKFIMEQDYGIYSPKSQSNLLKSIAVMIEYKNGNLPQEEYEKIKNMAKEMFNFDQ